MEHVVNGPRHRDEVTDINFHQPETVVALQMSNILRGPGHEIVQANYINATFQQPLRKMRADKPSAAR